jgi:hypothetical protein
MTFGAGGIPQKRGFDSNFGSCGESVSQRGAPGFVLKLRRFARIAGSHVSALPLA